MSDAARAVPDGELTAAEFAALWHLAKRLQECDSVAEADAVAAQAEVQGTRGTPAFERAIGETVGPALENVRERERLRSLVIRDPLTGLYNRRFMEEEFTSQIGHARRLGQPLAVALLDLDRFRDSNELHGHLAGDLVLQWLADLLEGFRRGGAVPCRYGGEEFVLIMPGATAARAVGRLEPLRRRLAEAGIHREGRPLHPITASIGVAEFPVHGVTATALLDAADGAMYRAKRGGRNLIRVAGDEGRDLSGRPAARSPRERETGETRGA